MKEVLGSSPVGKHSHENPKTHSRAQTQHASQRWVSMSLPISTGDREASTGSPQVPLTPRLVVVLPASPHVSHCACSRKGVTVVAVGLWGPRWGGVGLPRLCAPRDQVAGAYMSREVSWESSLGLGCLSH